MFDKKKLNFWRLAFIYGGIAIITLFFLWSSPNIEKSSMMNSSMGNTMKSEQLKGATIYDLFSTEKMSGQMSSMASHTGSVEPVKYSIGFLGTSIIFLLLPFIIGGTIILAIVWIK